MSEVTWAKIEEIQGARPSHAAVTFSDLAALFGVSAPAPVPEPVSTASVTVEPAPAAPSV